MRFSQILPKTSFFYSFHLCPKYMCDTCFLTNFGVQIPFMTIFLCFRHCHGQGYSYSSLNLTSKFKCVFLQIRLGTILKIDLGLEF